MPGSDSPVVQDRSWQTPRTLEFESVLAGSWLGYDSACGVKMGNMNRRSFLAALGIAPAVPQLAQRSARMAGQISAAQIKAGTVTCSRVTFKVPIPPEIPDFWNARFTVQPGIILLGSFIPSSCGGTFDSEEKAFHEFHYLNGHPWSGIDNCVSVWVPGTNHLLLHISIGAILV